MKVQLSCWRTIYHSHLIRELLSPPTDVIDWMLDNLIDKTRTRRGLMKKLKELGLFFAKPSRRRERQNPNWSEELDQELRELYAKYGEGETPMGNIMAELSDESKTQRMVVNRLSFLGCITGKAQVVPAKKRSKKATTKNAAAEDEDEDEFEFAQREDGTSFLRKKPKTPKQSDKKAQSKKKQKKGSKPARKASKKTFNISTAQELIKQLTEQGQSDALEWLKEAFEDVSEDLQDDDVDQDDAIPLVPITADQREAMENEEFKTLLREFGMQEPLEEMVRIFRRPVDGRVSIPAQVPLLLLVISMDRQSGGPGDAIQMQGLFN